MPATSLSFTPLLPFLPPSPLTGNLDIDGLFLRQGRDDGVVDLTRGLGGGTDFHDFGDDVREHVDLLAPVDFAFEGGREGERGEGGRSG